MHWLLLLLRFVGFGIVSSRSSILYCDNLSAIQLAKNPIFHDRTKHIEIDFHFVHEHVVRKDIFLQFVSTVHQLADLLTKGLTADRLLFLKSKLIPS